MKRLALGTIVLSMMLSGCAIYIQKQTTYTNILGDPVVVGEVVNNSSAPVSTTVRATLYDAAGNVVGVRDDYPCVDPLPAGATSPFEIYLEKGMGYHLETIIEPAGWQQPAWGLSVDARSWNDADGYLHIGGTVHNGGDKTWSFTKVCASFYDSNGNVVRTDFTYLDPDPAPGQTAPFEIELWDKVPVASFGVFVGGWD